MLDYVRSQVQRGVRLSQRQLTEDHYSAMELTRVEARRLVAELIAQGRLIHRRLPPEEQATRRQDYLEAVGEEAF